MNEWWWLPAQAWRIRYDHQEGILEIAEHVEQQQKSSDKFWRPFFGTRRRPAVGADRADSIQAQAQARTKILSCAGRSTRAPVHPNPLGGTTPHHTTASAHLFSRSTQALVQLAIQFKYLA